MPCERPRPSTGTIVTVSPVRSLARVDRSAIRQEAAIISAAIAAVTVALVGTGTPTLALTAGIAIAFQGMVIVTPDGPPMRAALLAIPLVAASALVAGLASPWPPARLVVCIVIAAIGGLATAWGRRAGSIGMLCAVVAALFSGQPASPHEAAVDAGVYALASCVSLALLAIPAVRAGTAHLTTTAPSVRALLMLPSATRRHAARYATGIGLATALAIVDPVARSF